MKISKSFMALVGVIVMVAGLASCTDWDQTDAPAGNQVYPTPEAMKTSYGFNEDVDITAIEYVTPSGTTCEIAEDEFLNSRVLHVNAGLARVVNQLTGTTLQNGGSVMFWLKTPADVADVTVLSFGDEELATAPIQLSSKGVLTFQASGQTVAEPLTTDVMSDGEWHYVGLQMSTTGYKLYVDGEVAIEKTATKDEAALYAELVRTLNSEPYVLLGSDEAVDLYYDDVKFYRNTPANVRPYARPAIKKDDSVKLPTPVYFNDFSSSDGLTIVGGGYFRNDSDPLFGRVFQNAASSAPRQNYLLLPDHVLSHSAESRQMTIGFWVSAANAGASAGYMWAPLFMAYGQKNDPNTWPMFSCQYRGLLQVNCAGWTNYDDDYNVNGASRLYNGDTDWLADKQWHYYTVVLDGENAKVYFDGTVANEWEMSGERTQQGLFTNGADLKYVCLGGNQAWEWPDNDAAFAFDDFVVYDEALSAEQISQIMSNKSGSNVTLPESYYRFTFDNMDGLSIVGAGEIVDDQIGTHGKIFRNAASTSPRQNYLLLPKDVFSRSVESEELSIAFWINASQAGQPSAYAYAPLMGAYGKSPTENGGNNDNNWPVFVLQSRGFAQLNCDGWCNFGPELNVDGKNHVYNTSAWEAGDAAYINSGNWLEDQEWHLYTLTLTTTQATIYLDGEIKNRWEVDGSSNGQKISGLFAHGSDFGYVCLGGNQAWAWGDNDAAFEFDDVQFFDFVLSTQDMQALMNQYK